MKRHLALALSALVAIASPAAAQSNINSQFQAWLKNDVWPEAQKRGVSSGTFNEAFNGVAPNLKLPDLILPGQKPETPKVQHQAEFGSPGAYFAEKTVSGVSAGGRARAGKLKQNLDAIERRYGVPRGILLAIWGRESGFGTARIPYNALEVLGTKAFLATRKDMFRAELLAALEMIEERHTSVAAMKSSWAGALGQPQFMPTSYLKYAVDGDGDGRADIWKSEPDTLASIANYLAQRGWVEGRDWGFEVSVPDNVSCALEGPDRGKRISDWAAMGISRVNGRAFPENEARQEGFLLMPAGRAGPAFIVTPNFYALKEYNFSDNYALFVGHAADRIMYGDKTFTAGWGEVGGLYRSDVASMQRGLEKLGYDVGSADGLPGFRTRRSIGEWQQKAGQRATCYPDAGIVSTLK
jgi:lytic murein transglycosylase